MKTQRNHGAFVSVLLCILSGSLCAQQRAYNDPYTGENLNYIAFPLGGIGAGMICLQGNGMLGQFVLRYNKPDIHNDPIVFSAIHVKGDKPAARLLEGPFPDWKVFTRTDAGNGLGGTTYGLPRFKSAVFKARFPFATVNLSDADIPLDVELRAWSPFIPLDADSSSLPVAGLEYTFTNTADSAVEAVYSFNCSNFMTVQQAPKGAGVREYENGFILDQPANKSTPEAFGEFAAFVDAEDAKVNYAWFRGGWYDMLTIAWKDVEEGACYDKAAIKGRPASGGGTIFVPIKLGAGEKRTIKLMLCWYVPDTRLRFGKNAKKDQTEACDANADRCPVEGKVESTNHRPWYADRFANAAEVANFWKTNYAGLRKRSLQFSDCFYDTTLPPEVVEAVAANLTILKSPTVLRQTDGKLWNFEGCDCCHGSCTHVWNYAQAFCHLFPSLERTLRQTEFNESLSKSGHQVFRSGLPIRPITHGVLAAADGQLGCIMKVYREWRISGDTDWLKEYWPRLKMSLNYCIRTWDPEHSGVLLEPHHNTYDIEFWGADGMCSSFYLGALKAAAIMGKAAGDDVGEYEKLFEKGKKYVEEKLFDGEYFIQNIQWTGLRTKDPTKADSFNTHYSPEALELLQKEGPKYQYGKGCLSDGVLGAWMASLYGLGDVLDSAKVASHLKSVHKYNLKKDLSEHANPQRPGFAMGDDGGLLLCTWPKGGKLSLPFVYSNEVWTGIEYQVASHLIMKRMVDEGLEIVRTCRDRYAGRLRNPFNEYECGNWYARAMSSYALIQALTGARYDAVEKTLYLKPNIKGDFRSFFCTAGGYGTIGVKNGKPFVDIKQGNIPYERIEYSAY